MGQLERRQFLAGAGALLAARLARAQTRAPDRPRIVGILYLGSDPKLKANPVPEPNEYWGSADLRKLGWIEGKTLLIERRWADFKPERLPGLVQELLRMRADVLLTVGSQETLAAARATSTIPIVFLAVAFPVEQGLVDSFAKPGRNVTGTTIYGGFGMLQKSMELLRELAPAAKRLFILSGPSHTETVAGGQYDTSQFEATAAKQLGFELKSHPIQKAEDIDAALSGALAWGAQAIRVTGGSITGASRQQIAEFALRHRLPSLFASASSVEAGGLLSYFITFAELRAMVFRSHEYVDRILRGARPADLPVEQPSRYELVINLKTAKALGLKVPPSLLLRADRVIE